MRRFSRRYTRAPRSLVSPTSRPAMLAILTTTVIADSNGRPTEARLVLAEVSPDEFHAAVTSDSASSHPIDLATSDARGGPALLVQSTDDARAAETVEAEDPQHAARSSRIAAAVAACVERLLMPVAFPASCMRPAASQTQPLSPAVCMDDMPGYIQGATDRSAVAQPSTPHVLVVAALRRLCASAASGDDRWLETLRELLNLMGEEASAVDSSVPAAGAALVLSPKADLVSSESGSRPAPDPESAWRCGAGLAAGWTFVSASSGSTAALATAGWNARAEGERVAQGRLPTRLLAALAGVRPPLADPQDRRHRSDRDEHADSEAEYSSGRADLLAGGSGAPTLCPSSAALVADPSVEAAGATWETEASANVVAQGRLPTRLLAALAGVRPQRVGPQVRRHSSGGDAE
jgi:hypothetical protein